MAGLEDLPDPARDDAPADGALQGTAEPGDLTATAQGIRFALPKGGMNVKLKE